MQSNPIEVSTNLARRAGAIIRGSAGAPERIDRKSVVNLVTEADRAAEKLIIEGLSQAFPRDIVVGEETTPTGEDGRPLPSARPPDGVRRWYVDPIDGTTNFVHGIPHCAVSIGLIDAEGPLASVVYDPLKDEMFCAERGGGAYLGEQRLSVSSSTTLGDSLLVTGFPYDRRQHMEFYLDYFRAFLMNSRDLRRFGSAALDLAWVAAGRFDGFWEWNLHPWDTAAGWLLVLEAGGQVSDFDGQAYDPWTRTILATNGGIHAEATQLLATLPRRP